MTNLPCENNYLWIAEPPYDSDAYGIKVCGMNNYNIHWSMTRMVTVKFVFTKNYTDAFHLVYSAKSKLYILISLKVLMYCVTFFFHKIKYFILIYLVIGFLFLNRKCFGFKWKNIEK